MKKGMKSGIPKLKKKIGAFFVGEEGKISKNSLLKIGGVLTGLSSAALVMGGTTTTNELITTYSGDTATSSHSNHVSHASHGSHSSY